MHILGTIFIFILALKVCLGFYLQMSEVQAYLGESVILSCNGSGFPVEELHVHWEAMGKDVISLRGDVVMVGRGFEDRVNFLSDPTESEDLSLILSDVMLNDGDIYECLWEGTKPICSVLLQVSTPAFFTSYVEAFEGDGITLECFGNIPKNKPWEDIYVQWLKDDREILRLSSGKMDFGIDYSIMKLPSKHDISRGIFSLSITSVSVFDQGVYQCRYKNTDYEAPRSGFPETYKLTVWVLTDVSDTSVPETGTDSSVFSDVTSSTESLSSSSVVSPTYTSTSVPVWASVVSVETKVSAQTEISSSVSNHTYAGSIQTQTISSLPMLTYAERAEVMTDMSVPETGTDSVTMDMSVLETDTDSGQRDPLKFLLDEIPIRIGLISGVLFLTAVILGLLQVFGRI
ncbi:uncharacterized protein LOC122141197 [Cyprinus carpio]|uniref:Uncharacterized protein LOC122141197 n=1 Tax=Cyprinus carpio TaxID=7962 RepID=A0A9R0AMJ4_CYPCA|nr:uncharacterized protein LOC122141197 [Cyprinus carpio]